MRSQVPNTGQSSGSNNQKKSVFDRLGRQLDTGRSMKRRPSPGQYGDYMPPPQSSAHHDPDFGRYGPRDAHSQAELEWRYQNERRHMGGSGPYPRDGRHPGQMPSGPPPQQLQPPPPPHYDMEMNNARQPPYYPNPHPYHGGGPPGPPQPMGPGNMSINMHQQRSSPKYDRHGNLIAGFKERGSGPMRGLGPLDHHPGMSPSRSFMPPGGPMMHPGPPPLPHEMQPGVRPPVMYPPHRWCENMDPDFRPPPPTPHAVGRMMQEGRFSPADSRRYQQQQQPVMSLQPSVQRQNMTIGDAPRHTKWRERRDVITSLDKETAQSSSRTDSLKSTLQQPDNRIVAKSDLQIDGIRQSKMSSLSKQAKIEATNKVESDQVGKLDSMKQKEPVKSSTKQKIKRETEPQEISDGEIVDDEDSSDDSETAKGSANETLSKEVQGNSYISRTKNQRNLFGGRSRESHHYHESSIKKRRLLEREDYSMDYETISDEDLDDFMGDKKVTDLGPDDTKLSDRLTGEETKSLTELELLNALGLDWANLVEMAKQSKTNTTTNKDTSFIPGSALPRFSLSNYLPTLGITPELAGHELYDLVVKVCHP